MKKTTVSAVEAIEKQIAELSVLKDVVGFIQEQMDGINEAIENMETEIFESEAGGKMVDEDDCRREHIKDYQAKFAGFQSVLDKLIK